MRFFLFLILLIQSGFAIADDTTSDFTPTKGAITGRGTGPWDNRLLMAWSDDGLTFTHSGHVIADQANVPDLMAMSDGRLFLYFTGGQ